MAMIAIAGESFHVQDEGAREAPTLMLSNSLGTNLGMWDLQVPDWSRRFRVIRYDSRGHGATAAPERPYSIAELGRDALAIMDALGLATTHWCGLSMGGMVGQWLLTHAPERLGRVVLANTAAHMGLPDLWNERIRAVRRGGMAGLAETVLERWFTPRFRAAGGPFVEQVRRMLLTTPAQGYAGCCAAIRDMDQREAIRAARNPVLVIVGAHDPATPPAAGELIRDHIEGAKLMTLDAAHLSNIEQPDGFTRAVADFLDQAGLP